MSKRRWSIMRKVFLLLFLKMDFPAIVWSSIILELEENIIYLHEAEISLTRAIIQATERNKRGWESQH
jgi:hypothetical protein